MPKCSFIVSAYDRPDALALLLLSLKLQTEADWEVWVCDNGAVNYTRTVATICSVDPDDRRYHWLCTAAHSKNCYQSANFAAQKATGEYLCFPSDDGYYVPNFLKFMLEPQADLVLCDWLTDVRTRDERVFRYTVCHSKPCVNYVDKGGFLVRRSKFQPFPWEENIITADGLMVSRLLQDPTLTVDKASGVLWVHN